MAGYFLGIDQGTTLTTAVLVDEHMQIAAKASKAHRNFYPKSGWVEEDPLEIFDNCLEVTAEVLRKVPGASPASLLSFTMDHQGETCCIWERDTGLPVYRAIVWQDRRTSDLADRLLEEDGARIHSITGLRPDAYFSATKFRWILDHIPGSRERVRKGELLLGTLNTYIYWRLSRGACYATDPGSASVTMLMDLRKTEWSEELVDEILGIPASCLPEMRDSNAVYGYTDPSVFFGVSVPISGSVVDSPSSIIGGGCAGEGILKTSYGTGNFMTLQTGSFVSVSDERNISDCMWRIDGEAFYRMRGACYIAGAAVEWLEKGLRIIQSAAETSEIAASVPDTGDVFFVPAFSGLATPFWDPYARGCLIGITGGTTRAEIVRSVLEAIAYQVTCCYRTLSKAYGQESRLMRADGGMIENPFLMQFQADMLGFPVEIPVEKETAAYGAACLGALTQGALDSIESMREHVKIKAVYEPSISEDEREARLARWVRAAERSMGWAKEEGK